MKLISSLSTISMWLKSWARTKSQWIVCMDWYDRKRSTFMAHFHYRLGMKNLKKKSTLSNFVCCAYRTVGGVGNGLRSVTWNRDGGETTGHSEHFWMFEFQTIFSCMTRGIKIMKWNWEWYISWWFCDTAPMTMSKNFLHRSYVRRYFSTATFSHKNAVRFMKNLYMIWVDVDYTQDGKLSTLMV